LATIKGITVQIGADTTGLDAALKDVNKTSREISKELREVERLLKFNPHDTELLAQKQKLLADQVETTREKLNRLRQVQEQVNEQFRKGEIGEEQYRAFQRELIKTESQLRDYEKQLRAVNQQANAFTQAMLAASEKLQDVGKRLTDVGKDLSVKVSAPLAALGTVAAKAAIDFESAFAGVRKTVEATEDEFAALAEGIREMAKEIPAAATEIAGVAEAAGQLGIANDYILSFTRTMIDLGESTNMSAEEAATALARLANITQMPQSEFDRLGSTVVALGNNLATTEAEIVEMGLRLAGAGKQVGMTEAEILSLAGALSSVGIEAQAGGSAFSKVMVNMQLAAETGGEKLEQFAAVAGMSAEQFATAFQENAAQALIAFINGLQRAEQQGVSAIKVLDDMGITEVRMRDALLRAAGAGELFAESIKLGTQAWEENVALTREAEQRYATTESQLAIMRNKLQEVAITFGQILLPPLLAVVEKIGDFADWLDSLDPKIQQLIVTTGALVTALGPALLIAGQIINALSKIIGLMTVANLKIAAVVAAVAALGAVAYEAYRQWEHTKAYYVDAFEYIRAGVENAVLKIQVAFLELKHIVASFYEDVYSLFGFLEHLPFGLGDSFASYRQWISDVAAETGQSIDELRQRIEENSARMSQAVDGMREAQSQAWEGIMADLQAFSDFFKSDSDVRITITETSEKEQTAIVTQQAQERLNVLTESEEQQTQVVTEEEQKRIEARQKFEELWNLRLFELSATRREQLEAEYKAAIALAEELGADKTAVEEYFAIRRQQLLDAELAALQRQNERIRQLAKEMHDARVQLEESWQQRLWEYTASEIEKLEAAKQKELELAKKYGADTAAIEEYYALRTQEILDAQAQAIDERFKANNQRIRELAKKMYEDKVAYEQQWQDKLFELTATELEKLERAREEAIRIAREKGADITAIEEYYSILRQQIIEKETQEINAKFKAQSDAARAQAKAMMEERKRLEAEAERLLFNLTATDLEKLDREFEEAKALYAKYSADITALTEYYSRRRQEILDAEAEAERRRIDEANKVLEAQNQRVRQIAQQIAAERAKIEESWRDKLFDITATDLEKIEKAEQEALELARKYHADTTAIVEYFAIKRQEIQDAEAKAELERAEKAAKAEEDKNKAREAFEEEWNKKLLELSGDRLAILEYEKQQALAKAEALGADTTAILKYYAQKQAELADKPKQSWIKAAEDIGKAFETMALSVGKMFVTGTGRWEEILLTFVSSAIDHILVAAVGAMGIAELVSQAIANMWNPVGWVIIGGLLAALAVIQSNLQAKLGKVGGAVPPGSGGGGAGSGGTAPKPAGGRQVAEITGPTRDILTDLLSPLAHLGQIVAPIQDIRQILYERLPNFNQMEFAGAGAIGGDIVFESGAIVIHSSATNSTELSRNLLDQIEREMARRVNFGIRGRGGR
jgi:TP901 family phage tail tape measure protein